MSEPQNIKAQGIEPHSTEGSYVSGLRTLLATAKTQYQDEFEAWYDQANAVAVHDLTFTGWLIERKLQ
jgi:hypothetical protein